MDGSKQILQIFLFATVLGIIVLVGVLLVPWQSVNWGKLQLIPGSTVSVTGTASTEERNQIASFSAGVSAVNDSKDAAISEVNKKIEEIIEAVKTFGIPSEDIQTENLSVYQAEETYYEEGIQKSRPGQWRVSNSVSVKLRDVDRANEFADLLAKTGATNVYGPNFTIDDTKGGKSGLLEEAIKDARKKAETVAKASGKSLGEILSVTEGVQTGGFLGLEKLGGFGGGGASLEPGTSRIQKTVTVTFELK